MTTKITTKTKTMKVITTIETMTKKTFGKTKSIFLCEAKKVRLVCGEK